MNAEEKRMALQQKQQEKQQSLMEKFNKMSYFEAQYRHMGYARICGVDEAGRGPLAGPVCAAAVVLPDDCLILGLDDSKKLSEKNRERIYDEIVQKALHIGISLVSPKEIDAINILQATFLAMQQAVQKLEQMPDVTLVDGNSLPSLPMKTVAIVEGDGRSVSIAAASVVAKVTRDRLMQQYHLAFPAYGFDKHKGYGTKAHIEAIGTHGLCPIHRLSFIKESWL